MIRNNKNQKRISWKFKINLQWTARYILPLTIYLNKFLPYLLVLWTFAISFFTVLYCRLRRNCKYMAWQMNTCFLFESCRQNFRYNWIVVEHLVVVSSYQLDWIERLKISYVIFCLLLLPFVAGTGPRSIPVLGKGISTYKTWLFSWKLLGKMEAKEQWVVIKIAFYVFLVGCELDFT